MTVRSLLKRAGVVTAASTALVLAGTGSASAWHCFVPMYTLNGPTSPNWMVFSAEDGAYLEAGFSTECDAAREAGYATLREAGLPVGLKIFGKMTIGEGYNFHDLFSEGYEGPSGSGKGAATNPNGGNGTGLEYFESSSLPEQIVTTYVVAASAVDCGA